MGPLYSLSDFLGEYWICRRALMCSTGAAMNETVAPAITPAIAWPIVGSLWILESGRGRSCWAKAKGEAYMRCGLKRVW